MTFEETIGAAIDAKLAPLRSDPARAALLALAEDLGSYCADLVLSGKMLPQEDVLPTTGETVGLSADKSA